VDRDAIARDQRRRQIEEALDDERGREAALVHRLEEVVVEEEGSRVDEAVFARMQPEDVEVVREALGDLPPFDEEDDGVEGHDYFSEGIDLDEDGVDEEIARLQGEVAASQRRQLAFRRYLEALDS
jgi:hypothetical protein